MVNILNFDSMLDKRLDKEIINKVTLEPFNEYGKIPLFGDLTHTIAKEHYRSACRCDPILKLEWYEKQEEIRNISHYVVENYARIGALVADIANDNGNIYQLGCGAAIPSTSYALLSNKPITVVDKDKEEIKMARDLAKKVGANLEFITNTAENFIAKRGLKPEDTVIITRPDGTLSDYWRELLKKYEFNLVLLVDITAYCPQDEREMMVESIIEEDFTGYEVKTYTPTYIDQVLIFLASKDLSKV